MQIRAKQFFVGAVAVLAALLLMVPILFARAVDAQYQLPQKEITGVLMPNESEPQRILYAGAPLVAFPYYTDGIATVLIDLLPVEADLAVKEHISRGERLYRLAPDNILIWFNLSAEPAATSGSFFLNEESRFTVDDSSKLLLADDVLYFPALAIEETLETNETETGANDPLEPRESPEIPPTAEDIQTTLPGAADAPKWPEEYALAVLAYGRTPEEKIYIWIPHNSLEVVSPNVTNEPMQETMDVNPKEDATLEQELKVSEPISWQNLLLPALVLALLIAAIFLIFILVKMNKDSKRRAEQEKERQREWENKQQKIRVQRERQRQEEYERDQKAWEERLSRILEARETSNPQMACETDPALAETPTPPPPKPFWEEKNCQAFIQLYNRTPRKDFETWSEALLAGGCMSVQTLKVDTSNPMFKYTVQWENPTYSKFAAVEHSGCIYIVPTCNAETEQIFFDIGITLWLDTEGARDAKRYSLIYPALAEFENGFYICKEKGKLIAE